MHPFSGGTSLCRPLEGVYSPRGSTRAHRCLYLTMSWSFQHFLSFHITFYQTSHWTSFSFKTFVSDESIHGKPDTLDTFALWNPRQSCILHSIPWIPDSRYCSSDSNPALYVFRNPRLHSRISWIPESVHKQKFPRVRNPDSLTWSEYFPWAADRVIRLLASLIVNRLPLSVERFLGFVFAFKTNAHHSILCLDYNSPR